MRETCWADRFRAPDRTFCASNLREDPGMQRRLLIMGAAGRDFHNFNVAYRDDPGVEVVAFTATQIPFGSVPHASTGDSAGCLWSASL